jgi:hypothetical protein
MVCGATVPAVCSAQNALEGAVIAKYPLTRAKPDKSDIETPGAVLVLKKNNLLMYSTDTSKHSQVQYKNSKLVLGGMTSLFELNSALNTNSGGINERNFMSGDKVWLIGVEQVKDGLVLSLLSDPFPYGDATSRYMGSIKFPFPKNNPPPADQLIAEVGEVLSVDATATESAKNSLPAGAPAPPPSALAPLAPPPPPPDQPAAPAGPAADATAAPATISLGQKKAEVIAAFGPPVKDVKLSTKEILTYKDMKVTLVNGKVTDVQ